MRTAGPITSMRWRRWWKTAEAGRRLGINLWNQPPLKAMCTLPIHYVMGDGTLPRFGGRGEHSADRAADAPNYWRPQAGPFPGAGLDGWLPEEPAWVTVLTGRESRPRAAVPPMGQCRLSRHRTRDLADGRHCTLDSCHDLRSLRRWPRSLRQTELRVLWARTRTGRGPRPGRQPRPTASRFTTSGTVLPPATMRWSWTARPRRPQAASWNCLAHQPSYAAVAACCTQAYRGRVPPPVAPTRAAVPAGGR